MGKKRIAYFEPFYGGSHRAFVDGLVAHSGHSIDLFTLPDRFWKWRTRGAALEFFRRVPDPSPYDLVVASGMVNLAELQGMWKKPVETVLYMHENQLTYPLPEGTLRDANHVMTDLLSCVSANRILFNSHAHRDAFLDAAERFGSRMPDTRPGWIVPALRQKSSVLYPGIALGDDGIAERRDVGAPVLLWPHRWEYDKVPGDFLKVLQRLKQKSVPFRLVLLGDRGESIDPSLARIEAEFSSHVLFSGNTEAADYRGWLDRCDIVISASVQETFGIACIEAMDRGCFPLFPDRLSYPEIVPPDLHDLCLYNGLDDLADRIAGWVPDDGARHTLHHWTRQFDWSCTIGKFDAFLEKRSPVQAHDP